jgi:hypothetical protein
MKEEYFFSICLEENSIQAAIWTIKNGVADIVSISHSATHEDDETLVTAADSSLSYCIQNLPADATEPTRTVFGVPSSWVDSGQIEKQHLDKIRLLCNKLSLSPTGFVVLPEAIAHLYKAQEKTPISSVLLGIYPQSIDVSIFRLGNLSGSVNVSRSMNISDDVIEGLARFGQMDALPSRFLLYDSKVDDLEEIKQSLIKTDWGGGHETNVKFLHTPQIEIVEPEAKMAAVSLAGAAEIGQTSNINFESPNKKPTEIKESESNISEVEDLVDPAALGFTSSFTPTESGQTGAQNVMQEIRKERKKFNLKSFSFPKFRMEGILKNNSTFFAVIVIFFILVAGFLAFWFLPRAEVTIFISPQKISGHQNVKFDINASSIDYSKLVVPAKLIAVSATGDKTKTTSGTATVGTPAKGNVTFYNVGGSTTIPAGTTLTASSLQFSLDDDVQIASASGAAQAANAKGNITAKGVGADYNLAAGAYFSVGNFSTSLLQAKNDSALTGGSSREVTAVSKDDISSLTVDLTKSLTSQGKDQLNAKLTPDSILIESTINATPSSATFDHEVGDQANTVKLSETMKVSALSTSKTDLNNLAKQIFASQVKSGYVMNDSQIDYVFEAKDVSFMINLLPQLNNAKITSQIAGKGTAQAKKSLSNIDGYSDATIQIKPNIPFLQFLPHIPDHISIKVEAK